MHELDSFLLELGSSLRPLSDPTEIQALVTRLTRERLRADRCYFCEIEAGNAVIRKDASREDLASVVGTYPLDALPIFKAVIEAGQPFVVEDARTSAILDDTLRALCIELQVISFLDVPVMRGTEAVGILCITQCTPRTWLDSDIRLAIEAADRTWSAVARGRAMDVSNKLLESDRRKTEFLALLSHELRNPLSALRSAAELLNLIGSDDTRLPPIQQAIDRQTSHLARLVDGLLDISRISHGKIRLRLEKIDARDVLQAVIEDQSPQASAKALTLTTDQSSHPIWIHADRARTAQTLDNLVSNAIKFTPIGGSVRVSLAAKPDRAVFTVTDTGVGVDPEKLASLFIPFHQERVGISHAASGLGLGLAVAKGLVELQGGAIAAFSHGLGQGAEFRVELPTTTPPADLGADTLFPVSPRDVLIVEDDPISGGLLRALLAAQGHRVRLAQSGPEALEMLEEDSADIVFCDLQMPGMSGYEVVRAMRDNPATASIAVIALTGYGQPEDRKQTRQAGFDDHLVKGSPIPAITDVLRRF